MRRKLLIMLLVICLIPINTEAKAKYKKVEKRLYMGEFWITHYCPCSRCCGIGGGKVTASGTTPTAKRTVGVNPNLIAYGTKLKIGSKKSKTIYVAEDTGGGIGWKHLDVFCDTHSEALQAGVGYKKVWLITYKKVRMSEEGSNNK